MRFCMGWSELEGGRRGVGMGMGVLFIYGRLGYGDGL